MSARKKIVVPPSNGRTPSFEPEVARALGKVARNLREVLGVAQDLFALNAGVDRSYYGKIERGERQPSLGVLLRIARALGVTGAELLAAVEAELPNYSHQPAPKGAVYQGKEVTARSP